MEQQEEDDRLKAELESAKALVWEGEKELAGMRSRNEQLLKDNEQLKTQHQRELERSSDV